MLGFSAAGGGLVAEDGVLAAASAAVQRARADVTTHCQGLEQQIEGLAGSWAGEGATAFARLHEAWQDKQRRIVGALDGLAASLEATGRDTAATDAAQADATRLLAHRLG